MQDTSNKIETFYRNMLLKKSGQERLRMGFSQFEFCGEIILSSLDAKKINPQHLKQKLFLRLYSDKFSKPEIKKILSSL